MKRILFVDDEPSILDGLRRSLRSMRKEWKMLFAQSGREALKLMQSEPVDVVITDMKMPEMDGATLLREVRNLHPQTVRIILSGHSESEAIMRSIGSTHQYLSKPCDLEVLKKTLQRTDDLKSLLEHGSIKSLISRMDRLPSLPALFQQVIAELQKPNVSLESIGEIIKQDIAMSAKILQLVNSSYFGLRCQMTDVRRAVTHLGLETISSLVLGAGVFSHYEGVDLPGFSMDGLWRHSIRSANFAMIVSRLENLDSSKTADAYTASMIHDLGKLALVAEAPEMYSQVLDHATDNEVTLYEAELELLGTTHGQVGAYIIGLWGLPDSVLEALAFHDQPMACACTEFGILTIVHAASSLSGELDNSTDKGFTGAIDLEYLTSIGLEERLPVWHQACSEFYEGEVR